MFKRAMEFQVAKEGLSAVSASLASSPQPLTAITSPLIQDDFVHIFLMITDVLSMSNLFDAFF